MNDFGKIIDLIKTIQPLDYFQLHLSKSIKNANKGVFNTFFPGEQGYVPFEGPVEDSLNTLSVMYVCYVLSNYTGYGFNNTVQNVDGNTVNQWFVDNTNSVGKSMLLRYLNQDDTLGYCFQDKAHWAKVIADNVATSVFINNFLTELDSKGSKVSAYALLTLIKAFDNEGENYQKIVHVWQQNPRWSEIQEFDSYGWLDTCNTSFFLNNNGYNDVRSAVESACSQPSVYNYTQSHPRTFCQGGPAAHCTTIDEKENHRQTTYGTEVVSWLNSADGPKAFNFRSNSNPNNITDENLDAHSGGCMIQGTPILMADGTFKPIELISENDLIYSEGGRVSICSSELLVNDEITCLYAINGDEPFMSYEHAILTTRGWCSLMPHLSMQLNPQNTVTHLNIGDIVWKVANVSDGNVEYEQVVVENISTKTFQKGEAPLGYVFHIQEGYRSYHAHGYCCFSGYPQITTQYIAANVLSNMSKTEQITFNEKLEEMTPLFEKALGSNVIKAIKRVLKNPVATASRAKHTDSNGVNNLNPFYMNTSFVSPSLHVQHPVNTEQKSTEFHLINGILFINQTPVKTQVKGNLVRWNRLDELGQLERGTFRLTHAGLLAQGIVLNAGKESAFTASAVFGYNTQYTESQEYNLPWFEFDMGMEADENGGYHPFGKLIDPNDSDKTSELDKNTKMIFTLAENSDKQQVLQADVQFDVSYCGYGGSEWVEATFNFSMDYRSFTGTLYKYDPSQGDNRGTAYPLSGTCKNPMAFNQMIRMANQLATKKPESSLARPKIRSGFTASSNVNIPNSVNDLFTLPTPDLEKVHELSFSKLKNLMLYSIDDQQLKWFGEKRPTVNDINLTNKDIEVLKLDGVTNFLKDKFAIGYLTQAFSTSNDDKIKDVFSSLPNVDTKLNYYWQGVDNDTCFGKSKGYNLATSVLMDNAYAQSTPGLDRYLSDNPTSWAEKLYNYCITPITLNGIAMQNTVDGRKRLTHLVSMLHALDPMARVEQPDGAPTISYATSLYQKVMDYRFNEIIQKSITAGTKEDLVEYLTEYYKQYFTSILAGDKWADSVRGEAQKDLAEAMAEFGVDNVNAMVEKMQDIIADAAAVMMSLKDTPLGPRINQWAKKYPKISKFIGGSLTLAMYGYAIQSTIQGFMNWNELKLQEKTQLIINTVETVVSMCKDITVYKASQSVAKFGTSFDELMEASRIINQAQEGESIVLKGNRIVKVIMGIEMDELAAPFLAQGGRVSAAEVQMLGKLDAASMTWINLAKVGTVFARGMTILALGAACVVTGFQIANDFETGQSATIKTLDILQEIASGIAFLAEAGAGIAALIGIEVCSAIPVIGVVAAVIGIALAVALMFIHRNPPPTPEETFVEEHCKPFVLALAEPSQKFIDDQRIRNNHLNDKS